MKKLSVTSLVIGALLIVCGIVLIICGFVGYNPSVGMHSYRVNGWQMTMMRYDSTWGIAAATMLSVYVTIGVGAIISGLLLFIIASLLYFNSQPQAIPMCEEKPVAPPKKEPPQLAAPKKRRTTKAASVVSAQDVEPKTEGTDQPVINLGPPTDSK